MKIGVVFFVLILLVSSCTKTKAPKYNVVLISIDSFRRDHIHTYGYERDLTPNIDALAKTSWQFNNYYSTDFLTPESERSVHTGLYPDRFAVPNFKQKAMGLGELLRKQGYVTFGTGTSPEFKMLTEFRTLFEKSFDIFHLFEGSRVRNNRQLNWDRIANYVKNNKSRPMFLWFALGTVHAPYGYLLPNKFADPLYRGAFYGIHYFANMQYYYDGYVYDPREKGKRFKLAFKDMENHLIDKEVTGKFPKKVGSEDFKFLYDIYDNGVAQADWEVGKIVQILKDNNLYDNTIIVFQSEHGETLGERKYIAHTDIFDEMVHMPLVIHVPGTKAQVLNEKFVSGTDILPSVLDILQVPLPEYKLDGVSFIKRNGPALSARPERNEVFSVRKPLWETSLAVDTKNSIFDQLRDYQQMTGNDFNEYGIKNEKYKLIHRRARFAEMTYSAWTFISGKKLDIPEYEFYDVIKDPKELYPMPAKGADFEEMKKKLLTFEDKVRKDIDEKIIKKPLQDYR